MKIVVSYPGDVSRSASRKSSRGTGAAFSAPVLTLCLYRPVATEQSGVYFCHITEAAQWT